MRGILNSAIECLTMTNSEVQSAAISFMSCFLYLFEDEHSSKEKIIESTNLVTVVYE